MSSNSCGGDYQANLQSAGCLDVQGAGKRPTTNVRGGRESPRLVVAAIPLYLYMSGRIANNPNLLLYQWSLQQVKFLLFTRENA